MAAVNRSWFRLLGYTQRVHAARLAVCDPPAVDPTAAQVTDDDCPHWDTYRDDDGAIVCNDCNAWLGYPGDVDDRCPPHGIPRPAQLPDEELLTRAFGPTP